jgi:Phage late-transcription coactivator
MLSPDGVTDYSGQSVSINTSSTGTRMDILNPIKTLRDFQREVERIAFEQRISFMDAVLFYCETTGMEVDAAGALIRTSAKMKAMIQEEAEDLRYLPKTDKLPL